MKYIKLCMLIVLSFGMQQVRAAEESSDFAPDFARGFRLRQGYDGHVDGHVVGHGKASDFAKASTDRTTDKKDKNDFAQQEFQQKRQEIIDEDRFLSTLEAAMKEHKTSDEFNDTINTLIELKKQMRDELSNSKPLLK